jgi:hypothetical protein
LNPFPRKTGGKCWNIADIPTEFKEGMEAISRGDTFGLDEAMPELSSE